MERAVFIGKFLATMTFSLILQNELCADQVRLKNGDIITGKVTYRSQSVIIIETEAMGSISIKRRFVKSILSDEAEVSRSQAKKSKLWERKISLGYSMARGNTQNRQLSLDLFANRKTGYDEFTLKGYSFYSSSNRKMDAQKFYGMIRYAFSFWGNKWYNFYKLEADRDIFANVDYRLTPSVGLGYWFCDRPQWRAMLETAVGLEHTNFRKDSSDEDNTILIPRAFFEKRLFGDSKISQDASFYLASKDMGQYRLHSETVFTSPLNENLSLSLKLIDDYDSSPSSNAKKNDFRLIYSLDFSF
jgi:putative salt-induced outer membrane protein YdiY